MSQRNIPVDVYTLPAEQRQQLFLALFDADSTLPNVLNSEQRHRLYTVLVTIDSSLVGPLLNTHGVTNEQFPKGSAMNLIKFIEYEDYKKNQKQIKKESQWHEFLKLDKKQYLNFRNDLRNRAASRFSRGNPISRQPKGRAGEVIKDFKEANSTFPISEADFILHEWLTSYCNSTVDQAKKKKIAEAKEQGLPPPLPKKKNVRPPLNYKIAHEVTETSQHSRDAATTSEISASPTKMTVTEVVGGTSDEMPNASDIARELGNRESKIIKMYS
nr:263_t:CDS:2 [Entrophospora candida]